MRGRCTSGFKHDGIWWDERSYPAVAYVVNLLRDPMRTCTGLTTPSGNYRDRIARLTNSTDKEGSMRWNRFVSAAAAIFTASVALAQQKSSDQPADNMDILRDKIRADKKLLVAQNMSLTEAEAQKFWPVYEAYQKDLAASSNRLVKTVKEYAEAYNNRSITDEKARQLTDAILSIDQEEVDRNKTYLPKLRSALPDVKVARYLQIERKIRSVIWYDLARQVPLVE
jgi:Spy/CpxP family protein refolding chaperone